MDFFLDESGTESVLPSVSYLLSVSSSTRVVLPVISCGSGCKKSSTFFPLCPMSSEHCLKKLLTSVKLIARRSLYRHFFSSPLSPSQWSSRWDWPWFWSSIRRPSTSMVELYRTNRWKENYGNAYHVHLQLSIDAISIFSPKAWPKISNEL